VPIVVMVLFVVFMAVMAPDYQHQQRTFRTDFAFAVDLIHGPILAPVWIVLSFVKPETLRYFEITATPTGSFATFLGCVVWSAMLTGSAMLQGAIAIWWSRRETRRDGKVKGRVHTDLDGNTYERWP
jgi:hypothetical protein